MTDQISMKIKFNKSVFMVLACLFFVGYSNGFAQGKATKQNTAKQKAAPGKEQLKLMLDQIEIRGWIERPQTILVVPGVNPEVDGIGLDRSFVNEIMRPLDKDKFEKQKTRRRKEKVIPW